MFGVSRKNITVVRRETIASSLIYKLPKIEIDANKIKEGDKIIYIDSSYKIWSGIIQEIREEIISNRSFCRIFDVLIDSRGLEKECYCVYFGSSGKICIDKNDRYDLFDDVIGYED